MANTDDTLAVEDALELLLKENADDLGLLQITRGDDELLPKTPAINIIAENKTRELANTGMMVLNTFQFYFMVFHSNIRDQVATRRDCTLLAEAVEKVLHSDRQLGGLLIHSHVQSTSYGVANRGSEMIRSNRLLWVGQSKTRI